MVRNGLSAPKNHTVDTIWKTWISSRTVPDTTVWQQGLDQFHIRSTDLKRASIWPQFEVKVKFPVLNQLYRSNYMPNIFPKKPSRKVCYWKKWLSEEILVSKDSTRWALSFEPITKPYILQINEIINGSSLGWL